jgi:ADP-ribose pyrophosphatase YjhB (NUDIX family)
MALPPAIRSRLRATGYALFYRLPHRMRMRLVRVATPTYTVGAVILVRDAQAPPPGRLLLLRQPPGRGWTLPAGLLRRGESPVQGALRELVEETGISLRPEQLTQAVPSAMVHHRGRWVDLVYEARVPAQSTPLRVDGAEVYEAAWHPIDDLPPITRATARLLGHYGIGPEAADPSGSVTPTTPSDRDGPAST